MLIYAEANKLFALRRALFTAIMVNAFCNPVFHALIQVESNSSVSEMASVCSWKCVSLDKMLSQ